MAKRVRSRSAHRPGGQGPSRTKKTESATELSSATEPDVVPAAAGADIDSAMDAVVMETTEISIEEPVAAPAKPRRARRAAKVKADSLQAREAAESVYVREFFHRIGIVSAVLVAGLVIAWVLFVPMDLLGLY